MSSLWAKDDSSHSHNSKPKTSPTSQAMANEAALRHKHDMADARAMMAAPRKNRNNSNHGNNNNNNKNPSMTAAQATVALQALDEAEALHQRAKSFNDSPRYLQQALELYQQAIQLLLEYLRDSGNVQQQQHRQQHLDPGTLQARIQTALTDAEQIKTKLNKKQSSPPQQQQEQQQQHKQQTRIQPPRRAKTDKAEEEHQNGMLSTWFGGTGNNSDNSKPAQQPTERPSSASTAQSKPIATTRPRPSRGESARNNTSKPAIPPQSKPARNTGSPTAPATATSPRDAEFQNRVLDDFYIPSSTLQKTTWDDVAGLDDVKQALQESVILPLQRPDLFMGLRRPQNLLLYGPPGTGKTLLVRATASTSRALLFQCSAASLTSKWMGEAEKVVRALFQVAAAAARQHDTPALLFLDEVDSVLSNRSEGEHEASRRLKTEFMVQMEGLSKHTDTYGPTVLVLACTNCPWDLDPAVLRRFPRRLYVPLPDVNARQALLQHLLETQLKNDHSLMSRDIAEVARQLEGFSGSDIYAIASQAAFGPIREVSAQKLQSVEKLRPVSRNDWNVAIASAPPKSVTPKLLQQYRDWTNQQ